jgi:hypothetical protein
MSFSWVKSLPSKIVMTLDYSSNLIQRKIGVHIVLLHYLYSHNTQVRKLRWKSAYELSKIHNGLKLQQPLPLGGWDNYM